MTVDITYNNKSTIINDQSSVTLRCPSYIFGLQHMNIIMALYVTDMYIHNKVDLQGVGCGGKDWIDLAQDRDRWRALVSTVMNFGVP